MTHTPIRLGMVGGGKGAIAGHELAVGQEELPGVQKALVQLHDALDHREHVFERAHALGYRHEHGGAAPVVDVHIAHQPQDARGAQPRRQRRAVSADALRPAGRSHRVTAVSIEEAASAATTSTPASRRPCRAELDRALH